MKFLLCEHCGNLVGMVRESGVPMMCCGQKMTELVPGTSDGAAEKHVPSYEVDGYLVNVTVGSVEHPMTEEHYIEWVAIETEKGAQRKTLKPGDKPSLVFALSDDDKLDAVYAYCNLHGLWESRSW